MFFYDAPTKVTLPFNILGLVAVEFFAMHYVEIRRWRDFEARSPRAQLPVRSLPQMPRSLHLPTSYFVCNYHLAPSVRAAPSGSCLPRLPLAADGGC